MEGIMKQYFLLMILCFFLIGCANDSSNAFIELNGETEVTISVQTQYTDPGATILYNKESYDIQASCTVDTDTVGTYELTYDFTMDEFVAAQQTRIVHVVDTEAPTIALLNTETITVNYGVESLKDFFVIQDNYDSASEIQLVSVDGLNFNVLGQYTTAIYAVDSSGNQSSALACTITIMDSTSPSIVLLNDETITIRLEELFPVEIVSYSDNYDNEEHLTLFTDGMDSLIVGENTISVYVVDSSGNQSEVIEVTLMAIDDTPPTIAFSILDDFTQEQGIPYSNQYLILYDNADDFEDITLVVNGEIDVNTLGEYEMSYYAIDTSGNQSETITKTVTVVPQEDLNYYERFMKNNTSLYDDAKFTNSYMYDVLEKAYRGVVLDNEGNYELVYYFFLHNMLDGNHVLSKIEFVNRDGENIVYELDDEVMDYVFKIPIEFAGDRGYFNVKTYAHEEYPTTEVYWLGAFSFNGMDNLDLDYILSLDLKPGNLK